MRLRYLFSDMIMIYQGMARNVMQTFGSGKKKPPNAHVLSKIYMILQLSFIHRVSSMSRYCI